MSARLVMAILAGISTTIAGELPAQDAPHPLHQFYDLGDFKLKSGTVLPAARLLFVTHGRLDARKDNAWGHAAGAGWGVEDRNFFNREIARFLQ
jgi:hypothetical protein